MTQIFVFGASSIYGVGAAKGSWVDLLKQKLHEQMYGEHSGEKLEVFNLGISGETSPELLKRIKNEIEARQVIHRDWQKIIFIHTGTNDSKAVGAPTQFISSA